MFDALGNGTMPKTPIAERKLLVQGGVLAHMGRIVAEAERWLRSVDHFDYLIRRWLFPVRFEEATNSAPLKKLSVQHNGLSSDIQRTIGRCLGAEYAVERSLPSRLARLLREFEQRNLQLETMTRRMC
jgi:hypothetical protein